MTCLVETGLLSSVHPQSETYAAAGEGSTHTNNTAFRDTWQDLLFSWFAPIYDCVD